MTQKMSKKSMINKKYKKLPYKGFFSAKIKNESKRIYKL